MLRAIAVVFYLLSSITARAKYEYLFNRPYADRYRDIDSVFYYNTPLRSDKTAFFGELDVLELEAAAAGDRELEAEGRLLRIAHHSASRQGDRNKTEHEAFSLIDFARKHKLRQIELRCRQFLGRYYIEKAARYVDGIEQFLQSYHILQELTIEEFPTKKEHIYNIAHAYYAYGDVNSAKNYMREAEETDMPGGAAMSDDKNKIYTYIDLENTLGLIYRNEGKYDSAMYFFTIVQNLAERQNDSVWMGIAAGNMGISYYLQKRYDEAIPLLQKDIYHSYKGGEYDNGTNSLIRLAEIYLYKRHMPMVKLLADSAYRMLAYTLEPAQHMQHLGLILSRYHASMGNTSLAYSFLDSARAAKEIIDRKKNAMTLAYQQHKLDLQQHQAEMQMAEDEKQIQILKRNTFIGGILLLGTFVVFIINRQKKLYRQKSEIAELEKDNAEKELLSATAQLNEFTRSIHEKNQLIERITAEIAKYQSDHGQSEKTPDSEVLLELQQSIILTEEQWENFKANFEKVHSGYLLRLQKKLPDLTPAEVRFITLAKLGLSTKEMASMLGVSLAGVRNYRYRLRKKLNLPGDGSIEDVVNMI